MIEIENLTVRFGGVTPINDMSMTMDVGTNGLIGPNGAGKTTFFNVLSGFVRPAEGSVTAFGDDLLDIRRVVFSDRLLQRCHVAIDGLRAAGKGFGDQTFQAVDGFSTGGHYPA